MILAKGASPQERVGRKGKKRILMNMQSADAHLALAPGVLSGMHIVMSGVGSGIGAAAAQRCVDLGANVVGFDLMPTATSDARMTTLGVDISKHEEVRAAFARAMETLGRLDAVVNVAGIGHTGPITDVSAQDFARVMAVNVEGTFSMCREGVRIFRAQGAGGIIVNVASVAGIVGLPNRAVYTTSKGAVIALTRQLSVDHAAEGIRAVALCPGTVDTPWVGRLLAQSGQPAEAKRSLVARQPLGRLGTAPEMAEWICFLLTRSASFCTGLALVVDGGLSAG